MSNNDLFCNRCQSHHHPIACPLDDVAEDRKTRNSEALKSFTDYCEKHPTQRFWQALRNWSDYPFVYVGTDKPFDRFPKWLVDTFYWEGKSS